MGLGFASPDPVRADDTTEALVVWIGGDEAAGLIALSQLGRNGERKAQLALGLIDNETLYHGVWVQGLERQARVDLLLRPGGLSGQNWLSRMDQDPAPLWRNAWDGAARPELLQAFLAAGEDRAALVAGLRLAALQVRGFDRFSLDGTSPGWLRLLAHRDRAAANGVNPRAQTLPPGIHPGDPAVAVFPRWPFAPGRRSGWLVGQRPLGPADPVLLQQPLRCCPAGCLPHRAVAGYRRLWRLGPYPRALATPDGRGPFCQ
jgi:hypothetical protein